LALEFWTAIKRYQPSLHRLHPCQFYWWRSRCASKASNCWQAIMVSVLNEELKKNILNRRETNEKVGSAITLLRRQGYLPSVKYARCRPRLKMTWSTCFHFIMKPGQSPQPLLSALLPPHQIIDIALEHKMLTPEDVEEINEGLQPAPYSGGTITIKRFARFKPISCFFWPFPNGWTGFLSVLKYIKCFRLGMLAHSIARVLDRNKQYDVDAQTLLPDISCLYLKIAGKVKSWAGLWV